MTTTSSVPDPSTTAAETRSRGRGPMPARSLEDLLAVAPAVLGFWPEQDVVMLTFGARKPFHGRLDLPTRGDQDAASLRALTYKLLAPATQHGAKAVVFLLYGADLRDARGVWPALRRDCRRRGIQIAAVLAVGATTFRRLDGPEESDPEDYDVSNHPFVEQAIVEGRLEFSSRAEMVASLEPEEGAVAAVRDEIDRPGPTGVPSGAEDVELWAGIAAHVAARTAPDDVELARILVTLAAAPPDPMVLTGTEQRLADLQRRFWAGVLPRVPASHVPTVAALLGYASWRAGDGAMAWAAVDRARAVEPDHRAACCLADLLDSATPPR